MKEEGFSFVAWVARYPYVSLVLSTLFFIFFAYHCRYLKIVNNVDYFTVENEDTEYFRKFKKIFPKSEFFAITFKKENIFEKENLILIQDITSELLKMPEVLDVRSLANVDFIQGDQDSFTVRRFLKKVSDNQEENDKLRQEALSEELYVPNLISKNGDTASIVVFVKENNQDDAYRKAIIGKVDAILSKYADHAGRFYKAGWTITNIALSSILMGDIKVFVPLVYLLIAASVYLIFRNWALVLLAIINLSVSLISTIGLFGLTGISLNNLTAIVLPLCLTLSLADTIHIFAYLDKNLLRKYPNHKEALAYILSYLVKPCFFTSLTTGIGFASLAMSAITAMEDFAILASMSMMFEFFYSFFLLPALISIINPIYTFASFDSSIEAGANKQLNNWFNFLLKRYAGILLVTISLAFAGGYYLLQVPVESNVIKFFKKSSPLIQELDFVEANVGGVASFDVSYPSSQPDGIKDPLVLKYIDKVGTYIKTLPGVNSVTSLSDFFKKMNQSFHNEDPEFYVVPDDINQIEQYLLLYDGKDLENVVDTAFSHAKTSVRMNLHSSREQKELLRLVREFIAQHKPPSTLQPRVTGYAVNYTNVANEMVDGQLSSFATAVILVGLMMMILLKSFNLGLLSLVPNIYPILLTFGVMGVLSIPLDTGTIMIASVSLGIACDDTVHFLYVFREKLKEGLARMDALRYVVVLKGRAMISTSIILTLGFLVLITGQFVPVVHFGFLCTVTMIVAIAGDLLLLPALIIAWDKFKSGKN